LESKLESDLFLVGEDESQDTSSPISYTELFYSHFPSYLVMGMSAREYWDGDCSLVKCYRKAFELQRQNRNHEMWLQGMYFYEAMCNASPLFKDLVKGQVKPIPYPDEPYAITQKEVERRKMEKAKEDYERIKQKVEQFAERFNARKKGE